MSQASRTRKGIILAGGAGTRLYPMTSHVSKQLLPVFDKPMVYYPLTTLMLANIREILLISDPANLPAFKKLLGTGEDFGIKLSYAEQPQPRGIAESFLIAEDFIDGDDITLILGDNIFYSQGLRHLLNNASAKKSGATIFCYNVKNPSDYGVAVFDKNGRVTKLQEKPMEPSSNFAVTGLYFYDNQVTTFARKLRPSKRGELEITDLNNLYLEQNSLEVLTLSRGTAWLDMGTPEHLLDAANFVRVVEQRQGLKIGCPEEIAFKMKFIGSDKLVQIIKNTGNNTYSKYLQTILDGASS